MSFSLESLPPLMTMPSSSCRTIQKSTDSEHPGPSLHGGDGRIEYICREVVRANGTGELTTDSIKKLRTVASLDASIIMYEVNGPEIVITHSVPKGITNRLVEMYFQEFLLDGITHCYIQTQNVYIEPLLEQWPRDRHSTYTQVYIFHVHVHREVVD